MVLGLLLMCFLGSIAWPNRRHNSSLRIERQSTSHGFKSRSSFEPWIWIPWNSRFWN
jgi:hypothetical protein